MDRINIHVEVPAMKLGSDENLSASLIVGPSSHAGNLTAISLECCSPVGQVLTEFGTDSHPFMLERLSPAVQTFPRQTLRQKALSSRVSGSA
jgi:hypothetical protein